jgi:CubicO group peptidase (beta-lactamase class C family)
MKKIITLFALFACLTGWAQKSKEYADAFRLIDQWIEVQREYQRLPGISIAVVSNQDIIWSKGYGYSNTSNKVPAATNTLYSICSISKLFTAVAIMQLYDAGKLRLDDTVDSLLPGYNLKQKYPNSGPITVRSLLTHSSGLPRESDYPYWTGPDFPFPKQEEVNSKLKEQETLYPASTYFQYSNLGLTLLGEIVEKVSGKKYEVYVEENILKPLRLNDTHPYLPKNEHGRKMAIGYGALKRDGTRDAVNLFDARGITAAAGFSSNVEDLARFASWQFRLLENEGTEILKSATLKEMQRVHWTDPDWTTTWGLGFSVSRQGQTTIVGHGGSCPGYRSTLQLDPKDKMAYTVMINAGGESPEFFAREIRELLAKVPGEKQALKAGVDLNKFSGIYSSQPWSSEFMIIPWYGDLAMIDLPNSNPDESMTLLRHVDGNTFRRVRTSDKTLAEEYIFETDASGKVVRLKRHSNYSKKIQ